MAELSLVPVEELRAEVAAREAAKKLIALEATRDEITAEIDLLPRAKAAGFTIEADARDDMWCVLVLPTDGEGNVDPEYIGKMAAYEHKNQARIQELPGERIRMNKGMAVQFLRAEESRLAAQAEE